MVEALCVRLVNLLIMPLYKQQPPGFRGQHGDALRLRIMSRRHTVRNWARMDSTTGRVLAVSPGSSCSIIEKEKQMGFNSVKFATALPLGSREGLCSLGLRPWNVNSFTLPAGHWGTLKSGYDQILLSQAYLIKWILFILTKAVPHCRLSVSRSTCEKILSRIKNGCLTLPR